MTSVAAPRPDVVLEAEPLVELATVIWTLEDSEDDVAKENEDEEVTELPARLLVENGVGSAICVVDVTLLIPKAQG